MRNWPLEDPCIGLIVSKGGNRDGGEIVEACDDWDFGEYLACSTFCQCLVHLRNSLPNGKGQPVRGFGFGVWDTAIRALGYTGLICHFVWDRMLNLCERTPFTWVTARQAPADIVFQEIGSCNQPCVQ